MYARRARFRAFPHTGGKGPHGPDQPGKKRELNDPAEQQLWSLEIRAQCVERTEPRKRGEREPGRPGPLREEGDTFLEARPEAGFACERDVISLTSQAGATGITVS